MELSKIEKQTVIELQKLNFSETMEKILEDYKNLLSEKNIKVSKNIEQNIFNSLENVNLNTIISYEKDDKVFSVLEEN